MSFNIAITIPITFLRKLFQNVAIKIIYCTNYLSQLMQLLVAFDKYINSEQFKFRTVKISNCCPGPIKRK